MARPIVVLVLLAMGGLVLRPLGGVASAAWPVRLPALIERRGDTTVLVLGIDRRGTEPARTDAMALLRIGPRGTRTAVLSIPRDLWVTIPGREDDRINTAYLWGDLTQGDGVSLARRTVEETLGVRVDRVAVLDFSCFQEAVDAAGGLSVDVPQRLVDEGYPIDAARTAAVIFEPGRQTLLGPRALQYARMRTPDSDFGRIRRQHQLAAAFAKRLEEPLTLLAVAETALGRCPGSGTDLSLADLGSLAAVSALAGAPRLQLLDESMVTPTTMASGAQVLLPRWERIRPLVGEIFGRE